MRSGTCSSPRVPRRDPWTRLVEHAAEAVLACLGLCAPGVVLGAPPEVAPLSLELDGPGTNHDDPCLWVDPGNPGHSLLLMTSKSSGLVEVFRIPAGTLVDTIPGFVRANNCWVEGDLLLTTDALARHVTVHQLPDLAPAGTLAEDTLRPMGIATLHTPDGQTLVYVTDEGDASVHVYDLATRTLVRRFATGFGLRIEPVVADDRYQRVFVAREERGGHGIGLFTPEGTLVREFGAPAFASDTEGLALYACGDGGYLIAVDQNLTATEFEVFDRVTLEHLGTFTMQDGSGEYTSATDGIEILQTPLPGFPAGMLAACDGCNDNLPDQTDVMAWERIATVMGLDVCPGGAAADCATTPCMRRIIASADASVLRETPDVNLGGDPALLVDGDPDAQTLLRFEVPDLRGFDLQRATLRLTVDRQTGADSDAGGTLYATAGSWNEDTVTYATRPRSLGEPLGSAGATSLAQAVDFDVRRLVRLPGTYDFVVRGASANRARYRSREAEQSPPTLLLALHASTPPDLAITSPGDATRIAPRTPLTLTARAMDAEDGDLTPAVQWRPNRDGALGTGGSVVVTTLGHGRHTLAATVADGAGLQATSAVHVLVDSAPVLALDPFPDGSRVPGGQTLLLSARARDAEDGDLEHAVRWYSDRDGDLGSGGTLAVLLSEGTHHLHARVEDTDGVAADETRTVVVTPSAPALTIALPAPAAAGVTGEAVVFAGAALDFADGDVAPALTWESDLQGTLGTGARLTVTGLVAGTHLITARATDHDGLTGTATVPLRILPATLVLPALADAHVRADRPTTNYGRGATLQVRADREVLLRFVVDGTAGVRVRRAALRLTVSNAAGSGSGSGGTVFGSETSWGERLVTYATRPPAGGALAGTGPVAQGQRVEFDVTPAVTGDGPVGFVVRSTSTNMVKYVSREASGGRPALVLQLGSTLTAPDPETTVAVTAPADGDVIALGTPITLAAIVTKAGKPGLEAALVWSSDLAGILGTGTPLTVPVLPTGRHHLRAEVSDGHGRGAVGQATLIVNAPPRVARPRTVTGGTPVCLTPTPWAESTLASYWSRAAAADGPQLLVTVE